MVDDAGGSAARAFGLRWFPMTVFVDANGIVLGRAIGAIGVESLLSAIAQMG